jgi:hypothetical protein
VLDFDDAAMAEAGEGPGRRVVCPKTGFVLLLPKPLKVDAVCPKTGLASLFPIVFGEEIESPNSGLAELAAKGLGVTVDEPKRGVAALIAKGLGLAADPPKMGFAALAPNGVRVEPNIELAIPPKGFEVVDTPKVGLVPLPKGAFVIDLPKVGMEEEDSSIREGSSVNVVVVDKAVLPTPDSPFGLSIADAKNWSLLLLATTNNDIVPSDEVNKSPFCWVANCMAAIPSGYAYSSSSFVRVVAFDPSFNSDTCQFLLPSLVRTPISLPTFVATNKIEVLSLASIYVV